MDGAAKLLGAAYCYGYGTNIDLDKAFRLYEEGAENGDTYAMLSLGGLYNVGEGCEKDWKKAFDLISQAADLGNDEALEDLSYFYDEGGELENKEELLKCLIRIMEISEDEDLLETTKRRIEELNN